ncbi:DnaJ-domain-containing protein [Aspergillus sclerotioniger CBS 115572]|uniref:DnaJ-domain-containing protein n=1 Tax=Aspergillus sclerotioniger CBS 115572 TaxID=1450535 RepID=A0A317WUP9_9EURO|nr:DnaJ-domain-containing protein [Aspergillus sclerotioniger CBS 115572]PWY89541.1 DnaJ-domain-containing protein [Aspergillus sclerotioniger CBS 115572]
MSIPGEAFWDKPIFENDESDESDEEAKADVPREAPLESDLYDILGVEHDATPDQIKTAYKKKALKHHPDKAPPNLKEEANTKFQQIAFAYAVLSDEGRREKFDRTGSTAKAVYEDDDFDWLDFYREQFSAAIDENALDQIKKDYQRSEEEAKDVLAAYETHRGDLDKVYESVMLCNVIDDDERFRAIIDTAIAEGKTKEYKKYKGASTGDMSDLAALIRQRQATRIDAFFGKMDEKYDLDPDTGKPRSRKRPAKEPTDKEFNAAAARLGHNKRKKSKA